MNLRQWKFNPTPYHPSLIKDHFKLFRKSLYNEYRYSILTIFIETTIKYNTNITSILPPVDIDLLNPFYINDMSEKAFYKQRFVLTVPYAMIMQLNRQSVHQFFIYLDQTYLNMNTENSVFLDKDIKFKQILFLYRIIDKEQYDLFKLDNRYLSF